jgi:hypothetical protein
MLTLTPEHSEPIQIVCPCGTIIRIHRGPHGREINIEVGRDADICRITAAPGELFRSNPMDYHAEPATDPAGRHYCEIVDRGLSAVIHRTRKRSSQAAAIEDGQRFISRQRLSAIQHAQVQS